MTIRSRGPSSPDVLGGDGASGRTRDRAIGASTDAEAVSDLGERDHGHLNRFTVARYIETPEDIAVPVIDDVPLYELLGDRYPGLPLRLVAPPARQWLGLPTYVENDRVVILDGTCGAAGCCGVMARIALTPRRVIWRDFFARGSPDLPGGLRFEFDRTAYENALAALPMAPRVDWSDDEGE